jgi:hypothetical protein
MGKRLIARNTLLRSVSRTPKTGGKAKFTFPLTPKIARGLGWPELPDGTKGWSPEDSELSATLIELKPNNEELKAVSCVIDCQHMGDFQIICKAKKKGKDSVKGSEKITEVMCTVTFGDPLGCAKLEAYMLSAARSEMLVVYNPQPLQDELPGTRVGLTGPDSQLPLDGVQPTAEQAAEVAGIPTEGQTAEKAVAEIVERRKRGRPAKDVQ